MAGLGAEVGAIGYGRTVRYGMHPVSGATTAKVSRREPLIDAPGLPTPQFLLGLDLRGARARGLARVYRIGRVSDLTATPIMELAGSYPQFKEILDSFGLDTCCGGHFSVAKATAHDGIDLAPVMEGAARGALETHPGRGLHHDSHRATDDDGRTLAVQRAVGAGRGGSSASAPRPMVRRKNRRGDQKGRAAATAEAWVFGNNSPRHEGFDHCVTIHAADGANLRARDRLLVGDDRQRLK
jgi:hypothetical protein